MQTSTFQMKAHVFTHVDAPLHFIQEGKSIDELHLDQLVGRASFIDVSYKQANEAITANDIVEHSNHVREGDIVLIKTGWDAHVSWKSKMYWTHAPYLRTEAAERLVQINVKAVGYDFPQEFVIRDLFTRSPKRWEYAVHIILLNQGILNIEYLINLHQLHKQIIQIFVLPLRLIGIEGAPARVLAIED
jgi:kynurenine formamidase